MSSKSKKKLEAMNALKAAILSIAIRVKEITVDDKEWMPPNILWLVDRDRNQHEFIINGSQEDQHQQCRDHCIEHEPLLAVYVVQSEAKEFDRDLPLLQEAKCEIDQRYEQQVQSDPLHSFQQTITCLATMRVNVSPCITFFAICKYATLQMRMNLGGTPSRPEWQECVECPANAVRTDSDGTIIKVDEWFEGVEWRDFKFDASRMRNNPLK